MIPIEEIARRLLAFFEGGMEADAPPRTVAHLVEAVFN